MSKNFLDLFRGCVITVRPIYLQYYSYIIRWVHRDLCEHIKQLSGPGALRKCMTILKVLSDEIKSVVVEGQERQRTEGISIVATGGAGCDKG